MLHLEAFGSDCIDHAANLHPRDKLGMAGLPTIYPVELSPRNTRLGFSVSANERLIRHRAG